MDGMGRLTAYHAARKEIWQADILCWKSTSLLGRAIAFATCGSYSHAGLAVWVHPDLILQAETLQFHGGRLVTLSSQVARWPGRCDVFRLPLFEKQRQAAAERMMRRAGQPYGWRDFWHILARKVGRWVGIKCRHALGIAPISHPLVCSAAVADSIRYAGYGLLLDKPVWSITPNDLAGAAEYQFTLGGEP